MFYKEEELQYRVILEGHVHALSFKMITSKLFLGMYLK